MPGVDEWCDVELGFPGGATGLSANTMAAADYSFTFASSAPREICWCTTSSSPTKTTG